MRHSIAILSIVAFVLLSGFTLKKTEAGDHTIHFSTREVAVYVKGLFPADRELLEAGLHVWTATCATFTPMLVDGEPRERSGDTVTVEWRDDWGEYDEAELGHTITLSNTRTGEILEARIELNGNHVFALHGQACTGEFDVTTVVAHEFGHAAGLGHSSEAGALMTATRRMGVHQHELSPDDRAGFCEIYPVEPVEEVIIGEGGCTCLAAPMNNQGFVSIVTTFIVAGWLYRRRRVRKT